MDKIKVLIADDHTLVRMGLRLLVSSQRDLELVGEVENGREAIAAVSQKRPDVIVMDLMMPELDGIEATALITAQHPQTHVVILTSFSTSDGIAHALSNGALGAVLKNETETELVKAIHAAANGQRHISEEIQAQLAADPPAHPLSPRQLEILASITRGLSNADIALELGINEVTVKTHVTTILERLGAANRSEAAAIALRKQLVKM